MATGGPARKGQKPTSGGTGFTQTLFPPQAKRRPLRPRWPSPGVDAMFRRFLLGLGLAVAAFGALLVLLPSAEAATMEFSPVNGNIREGQSIAITLDAV